MSKLNWTKAATPKHGTEPAFKPAKQPAKGGWTHIKQQPVKTYTSEEIAAFMEGRGI